MTYDYMSFCEGHWEGFVHEINGEYLCAAVTPYRIKAGMKFIYQSPLICYLSVLTISNQYDTNSFIQALQKHLRTFKYVPKLFYKEIEVSDWSGYKHTSWQGLEINLHQDYKDLLSGYSRHRKMRLKQTIKSSQKIVLSSDVELFFSLHEEHTVPRIGSLSLTQSTQMKKLWMQLITKGQAEIYFSEFEGKSIAGTLIGKFGTTIYSLASTSTQEGRRLNGMTLLTDHIIKKYSTSNYEIFDLGTRAVDSIDDFKLSFGANSYPIYQLFRNDLPWYFKVPKKVLNFWGVGLQ